MSTKIAVKVENISKRYRIGLKEEIHDSVGGAIASWLGSPIKNFRRLKKLSSFDDESEEDIIWAVKDISFEVKEGEVLGIIGKNGAGKSTLLKILSKITEPTSGRIEINGRVASLLEVGTGFHGELTGRENVYLNGTILGMTKKEVDTKFDEIVYFSGVEKFIDTPVKRYSSGMTVRLAFAVAAHLEPQIMIIDEVLAVGDAEFQEKCLGKMKDIAGQGRTVLFVSHNMAAIKNLCEKSIFLEDGKIVEIGFSSEIVPNYLNRNLQTNTASVDEDTITKSIEGLKLRDTTVTLKKIAILNSNQELQRKFYSDEEIIIQCSFEIHKRVKDLRIICSLVDEIGTRMLLTQSVDERDINTNFNVLDSGNYTSLCIIPANLLGSNEYYLSVTIINPKLEHYGVSKILSFTVKFKGYNNVQYGSYENVYFRPKFKWDIKQDAMNEKHYAK